ncbi:MAG: hypothetical protein KAQ98_08345 [Bacteriovoracaceae bacterium]|nr:hypothetical protein [Bacteriovoracaceae bacterium]
MSTEPLMIKDVQRGYVQITQDITERRKNAIYQDEAVHKLTDCLEKLSKGDLNIKLSVPKSEKHTQKIYSYFCEIEKNFNNAVKSINDVIVQSVSSVDYVFNHFKGIRDTINDFHGGITENFKSANAALEISSKTMESANVGSEHMNSLTSSMGDIGSSSADISKIIKVIDEIAFQTNLLALNAAVEAARAGKHGKGFAVVADEVRNLATRSAKAAKETTSLIEDSVKKIGHGTSLTESTAEAFAGIFDMISKVSSMVTEINNASKKQTGDIEEIDKSLSDTRQLDTLKKKLSYFNVRR